MSAPDGSLYYGLVTHRRRRPREHKLAYRVYSFLLDLDALPSLDRGLKLFSHNRPNLFSFYDRDHGDHSGRPLRQWVDGHLRNAGLELPGGSVKMLCFPRVLGYAFNPISVYFCYRADGVLAAVLYEVHNTFGESHSYLIPVERHNKGVIRQSCDKEFYVSPFIDMEARYDFRLVPPAERMALVIDQADRDGALLTASIVGRRTALTDRALVAAFIRIPLVTFKVVAGIHWEALALWRKGARYHRRPAPPAQPVTIVMNAESS